MDPQSRVLLEQTGAALADANSTAAAATGAATGVYVGVMHMEYIQYMTSVWPFQPGCLSGNTVRKRRLALALIASEDQAQP